MSSIVFVYCFFVDFKRKNECIVRKRSKTNVLHRRDRIRWHYLSQLFLHYNFLEQFLRKWRRKRNTSDTKIRKFDVKILFVFFIKCNIAENRYKCIQTTRCSDVIDMETKKRFKTNLNISYVIHFYDPLNKFYHFQ